MPDQNNTNEELLEELNRTRKQNVFLSEQITSQNDRLQFESQQIYASAFNAVTQGIVISDSEQLITYVNPAFTTITGFSLEDCLGRNCRFLQGTMTDPEVRKSIREALAEGRKFSGVILNYRKDGTCFCNELTIDPVNDLEGNITHFVGITRDITARRDAERVLVRNTKLLEESQSIGKLGGWEFDLVENHLFWTAETYRIHETSPEEFNPTVDAGVSYFLPDSKRQIELALELAMTKGIGYDLELETYTTKGRIITVRTTCDVTMVDGKPVKLTGIFQDITEYKAAEKRLIFEIEKAKSNEEKFRLLFEQSSVGVAQIESKTGRFVKINKKYAQIVGYSVDEMLQSDFQSITYPEDLEVDLVNLKTLVRGEIRDFVREKRYIHKNGHIVWVDLSVSVVRNEGNSPDFHIAVVTDITKRKQAEFQQEFEILDKEALINSTSDLIWSLSKDFNLIAGNCAFIEGVSKFCSRTLKRGDFLLSNELFPEELVAFWKEIYEAALSGSSYQNEFYTPKTTNAPESWLELNINPIRDKDEIVAIACFGRDITERKTTELKLAKSFKELSDYQYALDQSAIVAVTDQYGMINYINDNFCAISKYNRDELLGQNHRIINSGHHPKEFFAELWATISNGKIWRGEIKNRTKDDTHYWVDTTIIPFLDEDNKPFQYLAIRIDVTSKKQAEELVKMQNEELLKTNQELDRFVYSASHDLRAPLKTMLGLIDIIGEEFEEDAKKNVLFMMRKTILKLDQFIGNILVYSRNSRLKIVKEEVNMKELAEEISESIQFIEGVNTIQLIVSVEDNMNIISDKERLRVILNNLISNAIKYSNPKVESYIKLSFLRSEANNIIIVEDNGIGIDSAHTDKVFDMFYRGTTLSNGSGLGLYIVRETVEKLGGTISLKSELNVGTKIVVTIPDHK